MSGLFAAVVGFFVDHGYTLELTAAFTMFTVYFERRNLFYGRFLLGYLALLGYSFLWSFAAPALGLSGFPAFFLKYSVMLLIATLNVLFTRKVRTYSLLFVAVCGMATQHVVYVFYTIILVLSGFGFDSLFSAIANPLLVVLGYSVIFRIFYAKFRGVNQEKFESASNVFVGLVVVVLSIVLYLLVEETQVRFEQKMVYILFAFYDVICAALALILQYNIVVSRKLLDDNEILQYLVYRQENQYESLKNNMELVNIKCHDMKQQISMYEDRMDPGALQEIRDLIEIFEVNYKTGNEVLDAFLAEKSLLLKDQEIEFNCIIDGKALSFMPNSEIYTLFGNAFDNAVEALSRVRKKNKLLSISVKQRMDLVVIHFENTCNEEELDFRGEFPMTTKENHDYHGLGLRSMKLIAEKYGGTMSVTVREGIFNLNIVIPVPFTDET